jgi:type VI secretion system secreted protein Hcp
MRNHLSLFLLGGTAVIVAAIGFGAAAGQAQRRPLPPRSRAQVAGLQPTRAADVFLKIEGVEGEATQAAHDKWIEILSASWQQRNSSNHAPAPIGNGPGVLTVVRLADKANQKLSEACTSGRSLGSVLLHTRTTGGSYEEYAIDDANIASCTQDSSGGRPVETITLNFGKVESPRDPEGDPDRPLTIGR